MPDRDWRTIVSRGIALVLVLGSLGFVAMVVHAGGWDYVLDAARTLSPLHAIAAIALVVAACAADSLRYHVIARPLGVTQSPRRWVSVALVNLFGAYAANLGAPAAAYVLSQRNVDGGTSFAVSIAKQSLFVPAAFGPMCVLMVVDPTLAGGPVFRATLWTIGAIGVATLAGLFVVATWPRTAARWLAHTPLPAAATGRFVTAISTIFRSPRTLVASLVVAVINQVALAAVAVVVMIGLGADASPGLWASSFVFSAVSQAAPTPAGAGISEVAGVWLFAPYAPIPIVTAQVVLWRFLALQVPILVGGLILAHAAQRAGSGRVSP